MRLLKFIVIESRRASESLLRNMPFVNGESVRSKKPYIDRLIINGRGKHGYVFTYTKYKFCINKYYDRKMIYKHVCDSKYCRLQKRRLYDKLYIYRWRERELMAEFQLYYTNANHISFVRDRNAAVMICDTVNVEVKFDLDHYSDNNMYRTYNNILEVDCGYADGSATIHRVALGSSYFMPGIVIDMCKLNV